MELPLTLHGLGLCLPCKFFKIYVTGTVQISPIRVLVHFLILNRPELCVLNELVLVYESLHGLPGDVVIILPILLTRARLSEYFQYRDRLIFQFNSNKMAPPGCVRHTEPEILPELRHELLHHGGLA